MKKEKYDLHLDIQRLANDLDITINQMSWELQFESGNLYKIASGNRTVPPTLLLKLIDIYGLEPNKIFEYRIKKDTVN